METECNCKPLNYFEDLIALLDLNFTVQIDL